VIDAHCHIASVEHIPRSFIEGVAANMAVRMAAEGIEVPAAKLADLYADKLRDHQCDDLVAEMTAAGISKAVLLIPDFTYALRDCQLTIEESFVKHYQAMQRHQGKLVVFGGVDPRWGRDGVDLFERFVANCGFRGFKVYPPCGFSPSAAELFPFYEICAAWRLPVLIHIGPTSPVLSFQTSTPFDVDAAARQFPSVNFILAHAPVAFANECAMMCRFRPNVWLDVSGFQVVLPWDQKLTVIERLVNCGLTHKILFGTDWPAFRLQGTQQSFVEAVTAEDGPLRELNEDDRARFFGGNIERLLAAATVRAAQPVRQAGAV
jgi:predicted TIM-barrel fold metal-dependent hydrolase